MEVSGALKESVQSRKLPEVRWGGGSVYTSRYLVSMFGYYTRVSLGVVSFQLAFPQDRNCSSAPSTLWPNRSGKLVYTQPKETPPTNQSLPSLGLRPQSSTSSKSWRIYYAISCLHVISAHFVALSEFALSASRSRHKSFFPALHLLGNHITNAYFINIKSETICLSAV